jgi:hypothetical protein
MRTTSSNPFRRFAWRTAVTRAARVVRTSSRSVKEATVSSLNGCRIPNARRAGERTRASISD